MTAHTPGGDAEETARCKNELRQLARERRDRHTDAIADAARTTTMLGLLDATGLATRGHVVACYASVPPEPGTWPLVDALCARGTRVLLPVLRRHPDWAWYAGRAALTPSWHDIPEPTTPRLGAKALANAEAIVVSGLAGARSGHRVGTGGGWYDRALPFASPSARTFMLLNDDEVIAGIPAGPWDIRVDAIVTPTRVIVTTWGAGRGFFVPGVTDDGAWAPE